MADAHHAQLLARLDASCRRPVLTFLVSAVAWLLLGSLLALIASIKLHSPEFMADAEWLTFGRVRAAHLNAVAYGWAAMAALGVLLWLVPRLTRAPLRGSTWLVGVGWVWNALVTLGVSAILAGYSTSVEWLEFPLPIALCLAVCFAAVAIAAIDMLVRRQVEHIYVSLWYLTAVMVWFPVLYLTANIGLHGGVLTGVAQSMTNWWFAHNVLGLFVTPIALGTLYYVLPKVIGRPIHSYYLSLVGFWALALFYNWAGLHHLVGGPVPMWAVTVGIVASMMMLIPVATVAYNQHMTMRGHFHLLRTSPALRFVVFGGMSYFVVSVQGSFEALRGMSEVVHFTQYTVGHAHLGMYGFFSMIMFGAYYFVLPRLTGREWPSPALIQVHFWCSAIGIGVYFVALTIGGIQQGLLLADASVPFLEVVQATMPWLQARSISGLALTVAHLAFAAGVAGTVFGGPSQAGAPTLLGQPAGGGA
ncbi:MAG: cbb3-type cytochrome c oxidase subunit I [Polyangiaceae bacterium]|nr:cbb3-type cytochrome c oxidase subunit I [Polyangiaceae bacterium]